MCGATECWLSQRMCRFSRSATEDAAFVLYQSRAAEVERSEVGTTVTTSASSTSIALPSSSAAKRADVYAKVAADARPHGAEWA